MSYFVCEQLQELEYHTLIQCVAFKFAFQTWSMWSTPCPYSSQSQCPLLIATLISKNLENSQIHMY